MPKFRDQKEVLMYSLVSHEKTTSSLLPIADFFSTANDSTSIYCYLKKIIEKYSTLAFFENPKIVVTDFSWANIHACTKAFNNIKVIDYLFLTFELIVKKNISALSVIKTMICLCSTHFLKNVIDETDRILHKEDTNRSKRIKRAFVVSFTLLQNSVSIDEFIENLMSIQIIFTSKMCSSEVVKHQSKIQRNSKIRNIDWLKNFPFQSKVDESNKKIFFSEVNSVNYSKDSPFTNYFNQILDKKSEEFVENSVEKKKNLFYNPSLFEIIKKKLHLVPFWSGILFQFFNCSKTRLSNNYVELWFHQLRNRILNINKRVKTTRLLYTSEIVTPLYFFLHSKYREQFEHRFNIQNQHQKRKIPSESNFEEKWAFKKSKKHKANYYDQEISFYSREMVKNPIESSFLIYEDSRESMDIDNLCENFGKGWILYA